MLLIIMDEKMKKYSRSNKDLEILKIKDKYELYNKLFVNSNCNCPWNIKYLKVERYKDLCYKCYHECVNCDLPVSYEHECFENCSKATQCNFCHYLRCNECWIPSKYKYLKFEAKENIISLMLSFKVLGISKNVVPLPVLTKIINYTLERHYDIDEVSDILSNYLKRLKNEFNNVCIITDMLNYILFNKNFLNDQKDIFGILREKLIKFAIVDKVFFIDQFKSLFGEDLRKIINDHN